METGLFVTFLDDEPSERELPPVGPLDQLVVRHRLLVCERTTVQQADDAGVPIDRWLEAELELQRAMGSEPGGARRAHLRVTAREGVLLRFTVFGEPSERDPVGELGPFAAVTVRRHSVEADGHVLATRKASEIAPWDIASAAGADYAGLSKADLAFRTPATAYHPQVSPLPARRGADTVAQPPPAHGTALTRPSAVTPDTMPEAPAPAAGPAPLPEPAAAPAVVADAIAPPPRSPEVVAPPEPEPDSTPAAAPDAAPAEAAPAADTAPVPEEPPALTPQDIQLIQRIEREREEETLRARMQEEERRRLGVAPEPEDTALTWAMRYRSTTAESTATEPTASPARELELRDLLWQLRFLVIGVLMLGVLGYGVLLVTGKSPVTGGSVGTSVRTIGVAQKVQSDTWEYIVNGTQRVQQAGTATPSGVYYVVRVGVTNRRTEGPSLSPSDFALVAPDGTQYSALGLASGAYQGPENTGSPYVWPQSFPVGKTVTMGVIFDLPPSIGRGLQLLLPDLPSVRVQLD